MSETVIYVSVTRGKDVLTLDGYLYLFGELLATINDATKQLAQVGPAPIFPTPAEGPKTADAQSLLTGGANVSAR